MFPILFIKIKYWTGFLVYYNSYLLYYIICVVVN